MFVEIWQNSLKNTCVGVSFLIKLQALACNFIKKETLAQVFSCEFCEISENVFSYRTPSLAASKRAIWFSDKELKERQRERERERDLKSTGADKDSITISYINAISRRDHSIDVSDNIYGCLSGFSCRCFFNEFLDRFRQCFKLSYSFEKELFLAFLEFPKEYSRKTVRWSLGLLMLPRGAFRTQSNNYDWAFLRK